MERWAGTRGKAWRRLLVSVGFMLLFLAACAQSVEPTEVERTIVVTQEVEAEEPFAGTSTPAGAPVPTSAPTLPPFPTPSPPLPTPTKALEPRLVELEWPPQMRLGDSDIVRLSIVPGEDGYIVTADFPDHQLDTQRVVVDRPQGFSVFAVARLDGVGFDISPAKEQEQLLPEREVVTWRWTLTPRNPGQQRLAVGLTLRWEPLGESTIPIRESLIFSRGLDVRVLSFLGLTHGQAMRAGLFGLIISGVVSVAAVFFRDRPLAETLQIVRHNPSLSLEAPPEMMVSPEERTLLQALFRQYARLLLEREFLSGYSGARTFLALPIRPDERADAHTIVKIGDRSAIQQEFENYETFVKDTLPPITARIQHPPVTVRGGVRAALRYTFIGEPGSVPQSLRGAFLDNPDHSLIHKLFDVFGPNWWMQRRAYTFRLAQEYDCLLPTYFVLEPTRGRGKVLDGRKPPVVDDIQIGDVVSLRGFASKELRADGKSLSLKGEVHPGQPPLRVRWMSLVEPNGATGQVIATRWTLLNDVVTDFDLHGLPDPIASLPTALNEHVAGTIATIHGDLNLENVLVGPGGIVWLIDFAQTRDGHPLFDFAHLHAEIIAHVIAEQVESAAEYLELLNAKTNPLLLAVQDVAERCLFNPAQPREYTLALYMACMGALKYVNLGPKAKYYLYLTAASLIDDL